MSNEIIWNCDCCKKEIRELDIYKEIELTRTTVCENCIENLVTIRLYLPN